MIKFNPTKKVYKSITGGVPEERFFTVALKVGKALNANRVFLCFHADGGQVFKRFMPLASEKKDFNVHKAKVCFAMRGLYYYHFELETPSGSRHVCAGDGLDGVLCDDVQNEFLLTVFAPSKSPSEWFKGGVIYHVFVDRFNKKNKRNYPMGCKYNENWLAVPDHRPVDGEILNNEFFGGNLEGVIDKLDYIKSLGTTVIYLSPIFKARSNHKYDTGDYLSVDDAFGDEEIFSRLIEGARERGMSVILDGVFSHTGDDSIYFNKYGNYDSVGAFQSMQSPFFEWYSFIDFPNEYKSWWGIVTLPEVDKTCKSYADFICGKVVPKWLSAGAKGFRLDVADELPDEFLYPLCKAVKDQGDNVIIGEVWENAADKISYGRRRKYFQGGQLDGVMNYPLKDAVLSFLKDGCGDELKNVVLRQLNDYPKDNLDKCFNIISSHDTKRALTALCGTEPQSKDERAVFKLHGEQLKEAKSKLMQAAVLQYTLFGVPCLYYGDEAGMQGFEDPFCRACYPWGHEDKRLIAFYRSLGALRTDKAFASAEVKNVRCRNGVFSFERRFEGGGYAVFVNASDKPRKITHKGKAVLSSGADGVVEPHGYKVLRF